MKLLLLLSKIIDSIKIHQCLSTSMRKCKKKMIKFNINIIICCNSLLAFDSRILFLTSICHINNSPQYVFILLSMHADNLFSFAYTMRE